MAFRKVSPGRRWWTSRDWEQPDFNCELCPDRPLFRSPMDARRRNHHLSSRHQRTIVWQCPYCVRMKDGDRFSDLRDHFFMSHGDLPRKSAIPRVVPFAEAEQMCAPRPSRSNLKCGKEDNRRKPSRSPVRRDAPGGSSGRSERRREDSRRQLSPQSSRCEKVQGGRRRRPRRRAASPAEDLGDPPLCRVSPPPPPPSPAQPIPCHNSRKPSPVKLVITRRRPAAATLTSTKCDAVASCTSIQPRVVESTPSGGSSSSALAVDSSDSSLESAAPALSLRACRLTPTSLRKEDVIAYVRSASCDVRKELSELLEELNIQDLAHTGHSGPNASAHLSGVYCEPTPQEQSTLSVAKTEMLLRFKPGKDEQPKTCISRAIGVQTDRQTTVHFTGRDSVLESYNFSLRIHGGLQLRQSPDPSPSPPSQ
jgi:hypothetical protein